MGVKGRTLHLLIVLKISTLQWRIHVLLSVFSLCRHFKSLCEGFLKIFVCLGCLAEIFLHDLRKPSIVNASSSIVNLPGLMTFDDQQMALGCEYVHIFSSSKEKELNFTYSNMQFFSQGLMLQKFKTLLRYEQR
ncbi:uncharacterized protein [Solanum tuberosum]|uniref:uncharacterized protein isoform X2 n=1 Tax=Solanum tuberosum TaxID=4113 RepID=UPI00073A14AA|nr:PREDICTED: uncharacterized protein LOC107063323 isoform X2 [Solanum tuberosum]